MKTLTQEMLIATSVIAIALVELTEDETKLVFGGQQRDPSSSGEGQSRTSGADGIEIWSEMSYWRHLVTSKSIFKQQYFSMKRP